MKIRICIFLIMTIFLITSCVGEKKYTYAQLQEYTDVLNPLGTFFWDEFPELEEQNVLSYEESIILGSWNGFENESASSYRFFPNKLFIAGFREHRYSDRITKYLGELFGIWFINDGILTVRVLGNLHWEDGYMYSFCEPTETQLIQISDIDPIGYTRKPMAIINIPDEIKKQLDPKTMRYKPVRLARSLVSYNPLKEGDLTYGYFNHVEEMARRNLTGEQIANSPELVYEFFGNVPY